MRRLLLWLALGLALSLLLAFGAWPLLVLLGRAVGLPEAFDLGRIGAVYAEAGARTAFWNTLLISGLTTAFAVCLGAPLGFVLGRTALPGRRLLRTLLTLPAVVPPYLLGIAWIDLANPRTGLLNAAGSWVDIYGLLGIVWVLGLCFYPFVLLPVSTLLERMDASLEESARSSGAPPVRVFLGITLPLVSPAIASGAILVFLAAAATYGVPYLIGTAGAKRIPVLTTAIVGQISVGGAEALGRAIALGSGLLLLSALVAALGGFSARAERRYAVVSGKGVRPRPMRLSARTERILLFGLWTVATVAVLLPLLTLGWVSLIKAWGAGLGPGNWSLANYQRVLFQNRQTLPAAGDSLLLAVAAATLAVVIGGGLAYYRHKRPGPLAAALEALANTPYAVPGTLLALGLLLAWSRELRVIFFERLTLSLDLFSGVGALLAAYSTKYLAFGVRVAKGGLVQLDRSLEEAARTSGAGPLRGAFDVVLPLLLPSLGAAWLLVFLPVLSEITMSVLLVGPATPVLGTVLFELQSYADPPSAAVVAVLLVSATLLGNEILRRATGGRGGF
ncbi:MAG: iron ABC transporter permease [Myxococcota bacterium]